MAKGSVANFSSSELTEYFDYLDELRESGTTNMFGAATFLMEAQDLDRAAARSVLSAWMQTFSEKPASDRAFDALAKAEAA